MSVIQAQMCGGGVTDWIGDIIDHILANRNGRQVVLWGKYIISEQIAVQLKEEYDIEVAFYVVSSDRNPPDNGIIKPSSYLNGKAADYYVAVPLAFHQSIKDALTVYGFQTGRDYYYFCDCIVEQREDYYKDAHGNQIFGKYAGLKFAFSGFGASLNIGENTVLEKTAIYLHSGAEVFIEDGCKLTETTIDSFGENLSIGKGAVLGKTKICLCDGAEVIIEDSCKMAKTTIDSSGGSLSIGEGTEIRKAEIYLRSGTASVIGKRCRLNESALYMEPNAKLNIGDNFSIVKNCTMNIPYYTSVVIGYDCMFSWNVSLMSNDCHSIFDVGTKENINSTIEKSVLRKIVIGNHVWVGAHAILLYHTNIGDGSIIGAGSMVKGKIPNNCIAAGCPAKVIRRNVAWSRHDGEADISVCGEAYVRMTEDNRLTLL